MPVRVLIVDDHHQIAMSVLRDLHRATDLEPIGSCRNARAAEAMAISERPDVVLMDVVMPGKDPFESCRRIIDKTGGEVRVLFWTGYQREDFIHRCRSAGGSGIVSKGCETFEELVAVIQRVATGDEYWSPDWEYRLRQLEEGLELSPIEQLTPREIAIIHQLAADRKPVDIAVDLNLSPSTVYASITEAKEKLGCDGLPALVYRTTVECVVSPATMATDA